MVHQRLRQRIVGLTLLVLVIGFGVCYCQPSSGEWKVTTSFGEFTITVAAGGTSITQIKYALTGLSCGGMTYSGGLTSTSLWNITNNQFSIVTNLNPMSTGQTLTINGTFAPAGDQVSGTWLANIRGTICSGSWGPAGPVVSVEGDERIPKHFALEQNYPNPFNPTTVVSYQLPVASEVTLGVYDLLGREVRLLVNEEVEAGVHEVKFDASGLSSGVYLYRLSAVPLAGRDLNRTGGRAREAETFVKTHRLLLLR